MKVYYFLFSFLLVSCSLSVSNEPVDNNGGMDIPVNAIKEELSDGITKIKVNDGAGNLSQSGIVKDGKKQGNWVEYYPNAIIKSITPYVDGKIEGLRVEFGNSGQLEKSMEYHNGLLNGDYKELRYSSVKEERYYENGKLEGTVKIYYDNGKIMEEGLYKNGTRDGVSKWYDQGGNVTIEYEYKNGELVKK